MSLVAEAASRLRVRVDTARAARPGLARSPGPRSATSSAEDYARLAAAGTGASVASFDPETVARVFAGYEQAKRDRGRIDFEDILLCAAALMSEHAEVADTIRRTYRHLVVDEYQDVSPLQEALLTLWRGDRTDLCVVGDPAQTIHSFAGAQASFLTGFARPVPGRHGGPAGPRLPLHPAGGRPGQHDHGPAPPAAGSVAVDLQAQQPPGPEVELRRVAGRGRRGGRRSPTGSPAQAAAGIDYREMAVLFRINAQSPPIEQALADRGIPYLVRSGERFYERPEVRQALLILRTQARAEPRTSRTASVEQVKAVLGALGWTQQPPDGAGAVRERWESLAALLSVAEDLAAEAGGAGVEPLTLAAVSAELDRRAEAQHVPVAQGVTVSTLHSAKGLEWDAVALLGVHEGSLPFVLATTAGAGQRGAAAALRRGHPGPAAAPGLLVPDPQRRRQRPQRLPLPRPGAARRLGRRAGLGADHPPSGHGAVGALPLLRTPLSEAAERKMGRHTGCPATYDEDTMSRLREWRRQEAAEQKLPAYCIFTDATLVALAEGRPRNAAELIKIQGLGPAKAGKYGEHVLAILAAEAS